MLKSNAPFPLNHEGSSNFLFSPLASKTQLSQMSHKQEPCGMFLLQQNSLCAFKELYNCKKVNDILKVWMKQLAVSIFLAPLAMSMMSLRF